MNDKKTARELELEAENTKLKDEIKYLRVFFL